MAIATVVKGLAYTWVMRVMIAPDSFKGSLTAQQAADAIAAGVAQYCPTARVDLCPIADGGEGTTTAMIRATCGSCVLNTVTGPIGEPVTAMWGWLGDGDAGNDDHDDSGGAGDVSGADAHAGHTGKRAAVIELAAAAGMALVPTDQRDPTKTSTFGLGQLLAAALGAGADRIVLGLGGSATSDGGAGAVQALGGRFTLDDATTRSPGDPPMTGGDLARIVSVDLTELDPRLAHAELIVACDVTNPLHGDEGAACVYSPQKGATARQVADLDRGLARLADAVAMATGRDCRETPGAGAAGGMGFAAVAMLGGQLVRGIDLVLDSVRFDQRVALCDVCLTGEGKLDAQSASGKAVMGVANRAQAHGVPTYALVGAVGPGVESLPKHSLTGHRQIGPNVDVPTRMANARELLTEAASALLGQLTSG